jgi:uncharacterized membrane protein
MDLDLSKNVGGVGAILLFIGGLAFFIQPLLTLGLVIVGALLMLISLHSLSDYYKEKGIFSNGLYGFITIIVGSIVSFAGFVYLFFYTSYVSDFVSALYPGFNGDWANLPNLTVNQNVNPADIVPFLSPIIALLVVAWIFIIVASFFVWRSLKRMSSKSTVGLFSTAGILLLIGAIIPILGLLLMWIAILLMAIAFFQIKPQIQPPPETMTPPPTSITG